MKIKLYKEEGKLFRFSIRKERIRIGWAWIFLFITFFILGLDYFF